MWLMKTLLTSGCTNQRGAGPAGEIGGAVVELIIAGVVIERDAIVERLETKRKAVGNMIHKGVLRDAAEFVRKGQ